MITKIEKLIPDTSVIIEGLISKKIIKREIKTDSILIHEAVIAELEHQANLGRAIGFIGLDEIKRLKELDQNFELKFAGQRPKAAEIKYASMGEIDSMIRQLAYDEDGTLITSDKVQREVALARGIKVLYFSPKTAIKKLKLDKFFDETTMSVHLRENVVPYAKKGFPGNWKFVALSKNVLKQNELQDISREIIENTKLREDGFIEIEREGSTIVQLGRYRIVITKPPFADGWEITAVRPVRILSLEDYKLSEKLKKRISEQAEGILIAGAPGMGKCLPSDEIIYSKDFKPIIAEDLYNSDKDVIFSLNNNGKFTKDKIISKHKRLEKQLYDIETLTGRTVRVTPEHPLLLFRDGQVIWKEAKNVIKGDKIATLKKIRIEEDDTLDLLRFYDPEKTLCYLEDADIELPIYYKFLGSKREFLKLLYKNKKITAKEISILCNRSISQTREVLNELNKEGVLQKIAYTNEYGYLLEKDTFNLINNKILLLKDIEELKIDKGRIKKIAYWTTNSSKITFVTLPKKVTPSLCKFLGYICSEGGGEKISFSNKDETLKQDFKQSAKEVFGIKEWKTDRVTDYIDYCASLVPALRGMNYPIKKKKKSRIMKLPDFLFRCSFENLKYFIRAYFDGDGGINKSSRAIEFYTSSEETANQLPLLLMRLGIFSNLKKKFAKGAYRYTIRIFDISSIRLFSKHIIPLSSYKRNEILFCLKKRYSQTLNYDVSNIKKEMQNLIKIKLKNRVSIEKLDFALKRLYKEYFEFSSKNENLLILLKEFMDRLNYSSINFETNKHKLDYTTLIKNSMDHNCIRHWNNTRKIKISTLNKVSSILGTNINVSPKSISDVLLRTMRLSKCSIAEISNITDINCGTLQFRISNGWNTSIEELKQVYDALRLRFFERKKDFELMINKLKILCESDIFFDEVIKIEQYNGTFEVYDFETKNHNLICGKLPLLVHNSTFAQALAIHYSLKERIVKTVEAPRDLILPDEITQYSLSHGDAQEIHDILLLSRPDYTIFDEMRNTSDFKLFADLRLAGVGMVGVVHATNPIDAIQRFIGRVEMGVIPQIIDTVVFIKNGEVNKVLNLRMTVKVPSGMTEADLARPVVIVTDFETEKLIYEIYSYGEQTVVVPVQEDVIKKGVHRIAEEGIKKEFLNYAGNVDVTCVSDNKCIVKVPEKDIARIIGKEGKNINQLEKKLGMSIDIQELGVSESRKGERERNNEVPYNISQKKNSLILELGIKMQHKDVDIYIDGDFLLTAKAGATGLIKIKRDNQIGKQLVNALHSGKVIKLLA